MLESFPFGQLGIIASLFVEHDVVLLASPSRDLQQDVVQFVAKREAAGKRISTSKSEAMFLSQKRVDCPLQVGGGAEGGGLGEEGLEISKTLPPTQTRSR